MAHNGATDVPDQAPRLRKQAPRAFLGLAALTVVANGVLAGRLVWEQTALTWREGPQMVGFVLAHGLWFPLVLAPLLLPVLGIWGGIVLTRALRAHRHPGSVVVVSLAAGALVTAVMLTPYGVWQRLYIGRLIQRPDVAEFVTEAAATGDLRTVEAFLSKGVPINISGRNGTALHAAAVGNKPRVVEFLIAHGALVNAVDPFGDSPLEVAVANHSDRVARLLEEHGGRRIRGTPAQHDSVTRAQVDSDIVRMDRRTR